jgi:hypothetical protein
VILAGQEGSGAIKAGARLSMAHEGHVLETASAPVPSSFASAKDPTQSAGTPLAHGASAPATLHAPSTSTTQLQVGRLSSMPHAMMAPHSAPAPAFAHGTSTGGFRGGSGGASGGSSTGTTSASSSTSVTASPSASAHASSTGSTSHSGGSTGSSGSHR